MAAKVNLKVVNDGSEDIVRELLVDCENVFFHQTPDTKLYLVGYFKTALCFVPVWNPTKAQVINFSDDVVNSQLSLAGIYVLLANSQVQLFEHQINGEWTEVKCFDFGNIFPKSLVTFLPTADGFILCSRSQNSLAFSHSSFSNISEVIQKAVIDTFDDVGVPYLCLSPQSKLDEVALLIGTADGHIYQLSLKGTLSLLCDIQQPTLSIHVYLDEIFAVGKDGKIVWLNCRSKTAKVYFAPSSLAYCSTAGRNLYLHSPTELYSIEVKDEELGEPTHCPVKLVRAFFLANQSVFILAESGTVYQVDSQFETIERRWSITRREGEEIKALLEEIHRCADHTKQLNLINKEVGSDLEQVSTALQMLNNHDIVSKFHTTLWSYSVGSHSEVLHLCISNESKWSFPSSHWSIQVSVTGCESTQFSHQFTHDWHKNTKLQFEHLLQNQETQLANTTIKVSLIFRPEAKVASTCAFSIANSRLHLLDVLQAVQPTNFQLLVERKASAKVTALLGLTKATFATNPWRLLLRNCWHRGFSPLDSPDSHQQPVTARYGHIPVRLTLTLLNSVFVLRIETYEKELLDKLRMEIFQLLEAESASKKPPFVQIPAQATVDLQNLRSRLNYVQSLGNNADSLQEEFEMFIAQNLPII